MEAAPAPTGTTRDPLGDAIRATFRDAGLRIGVLAAALLVGLSWAAVFALSWLPGAFAAHSLGIVAGSGEHVSLGPRLAASLFAPWVSAEHFKAASSFDYSFRSVSLTAAAVLILVFLLVGQLVRSALSTLRSRAIALGVAALCVAAGLSIASIFVSYKIGIVTQTVKVTHSSSSLLWMPLLWTIGVGLFSFGVVGKLHAPFRVALRRGAAAIVLVAAAAAIAFPVIVVSWAPINQSGTVYWSTDFADGFWHWGGAIGSVATPLAFGAQAHLVAKDYNNPFTATTSEYSSAPDANLRLPALARYMEKHPDARLTGYAATGGTAAHFALLAGAVLVLLLCAFVAARATRALGAPRALDGLRHGALVGLAAFLAVLALKWIGVASVTPYASGESNDYPWQLQTSALFQTGGELLALCALSGLVYAALRPRPLQYAPWSCPSSSRSR